MVKKDTVVALGLTVGLALAGGTFLYTSADHMQKVGERQRLKVTIAESPVVRACGNGMVLRDVSGRLYLDAGQRSGWAAAGMQADEVCKG